MTKKIINIKYKIVYISLLFIVINISCSSKDINSLFNKQIKDHKMVNYRKGNFTNSGNNEYIVFYTETKGIDRKTIYFAKTNIYIVNKNKIIKSYYLKSAFSLKYDK